METYRQGFMKKKFNIPDYVTKLAQGLRKNETKSEKILWELLRKRKCSGYKFRRQQPVGRYITDFMCFEKKLIIEVDGKIHDDTKGYDEAKDLYLKSAGFKVMRISTEFIENYPQKVINLIQKILSNLPHNVPPSPRGEGGQGDEGRVKDSNNSDGYHSKIQRNTKNNKFSCIS